MLLGMSLIVVSLAVATVVQAALRRWPPDDDGWPLALFFWTYLGSAFALRLTPHEPVVSVVDDFSRRHWHDQRIGRTQHRKRDRAERRRRVENNDIKPIGYARNALCHAVDQVPLPARHSRRDFIF